MTKETIPAIALRVAEEMNDDPRCCTLARIEADDAIAFAERLMEEVTKQAEPVGYVGKVLPRGEGVIVIRLTPNDLKEDDRLFLHPSPDILELKAEVARLRAALDSLEGAHSTDRLIIKEALAAPKVSHA